MILRFIVRHNYFGLISKILSEEKRNKVIQVIADDKGLIAYEKKKGWYQTIDSIWKWQESGIFLKKVNFIAI